MAQLQACKPRKFCDRVQFQRRGPMASTIRVRQRAAAHPQFGLCRSQFLCRLRSAGAPMPSMLASTFGVPFVVGYVVSYMLVTMGAWVADVSYVDAAMQL